ncbi:MAG: helix-turn-helix domain-containing protein [Alphaproteobacteria bacterium]|nr:helix-turn-helix domain-containing protein [Alphaproteobacteria bacterium]
MHIVAAQSRAGRALLGWSQTALAEAAGVNKRTVMDFESGAREPHLGTLSLVRSALEGAGVEFIGGGAYQGEGGPGVRLKGGV